MAVKNPEDLKFPVYKILDEKGFYGPDLVLHEQGEMLGWKGEPNLQMKPMNKSARDAMNVFIDSLAADARKKAEKDGVEFKGLAPHLTQHLHDDSSDEESYENNGVLSLRSKVDGKAPILPKVKTSDPRVVVLSEKEPAKEIEALTLNLRSA